MAETMPKWTVESNNRRMDELEEITEGFLNLMPAHFYLDHDDEFEDDEAENSNKNSKKETRDEKEARWDPLNPQTTMQKVIEHARKQRSQGDSSNANQQNGGGNKAPNARSKKIEETPAHQDLKQKLHAKIAQLKEERRQVQSAKDRAQAEKYRQEKLQENPNYMTRADKENIYRKRKAGDDIEDDMDFGKMTFETKKADLPFEALRNAPGTKVKKLKKAIREAEQAEAAKADGGEDDDGEDVLNKAMKMASGEKMKDSLKKLKKTEKRMNQQKAKSAEAWHERKQDTEDSKALREDRRKENIKNRAKNKKKNRPGFEGEKDDFLNKKSDKKGQKA